MPVESDTQQHNDSAWALKNLPPFPWVATKMLQLFSTPDDDVEVGRLMELIRADASLTSEILRRANSPLYGLKSQVSSLQHAVVLLGFDHLKALAITIGVNAYVKTALRLSVLRRCWRHSLACAMLAEQLAQPCGISKDQAYTAGLLHDIGMLALLVNYPQPYANLLSVVLENRFALLASERDLFELDHCQAGALLAGQWNFPPELKGVVARHHDSPADARFDLLKLIHLSCRLADSLGFPVADPAEPENPAALLAELPPQVQAGLHVDTAALREDLTRKLSALE